MAVNTLKTRIIHKHDTEANWNKAVNFIPKNGELIIYDADNVYPFPRVKIGDGTTKVSNLKFINNDDSASITVDISIPTTGWVLNSETNYYDYTYTNSRINKYSKIFIGSSTTSYFIIYKIYDGYIVFTTPTQPTSPIVMSDCEIIL